MIENLFALQKLQRIDQSKNKLQLVDPTWGYRLLKESQIIITIVGPSVATKNDQNNKELDTILGNKSKGNNTPTKMLLEKLGVGKNNKPRNKPVNIDKIAFFSLNFF